MIRIVTICLALLLASCTALDAVTMGADLLAPAQNGIEANASVQLAKDAESNKNKVESNIQTESTNNVQAERVQYVSSGTPWFVWLMVLVAWLVKDPISTIADAIKKRYTSQ